MNYDNQAANALLRPQIDALVCGELSEEERRELLTWLDADASRWRACGLAFLEAQAWGEALADPVVTERCTKTTSEKSRLGIHLPVARQSKGARWSVPLLMAAASIVAFACGVAVQEFRLRAPQPVPPIAQPLPASETPLATSGPLVASVPVKGGPLGDIAATLQIPVRPVEATGLPLTSSVPQHVRNLWKRRGYELVEERRYLPARLPDGRQVMVPVNEVKMKFVGKPVS